MIPRWGWFVLALVLVGGGFLAGRASVVPNDQETRDSVAVYRGHRKEDRAANEQLQRDLAAEHAGRLRSEEATLRLTESAARLVAGAARTMVTANETKRRADSILASLRNAKTPAESIAVLTMACTERGNECALVRRANDSLFRATDSLTSAGDSAKRTVASFRRDSVKLIERIRSDSTRLAEADGLIVRLEKAAGGCRIPLVGVKCPVGVVSWDAQEPELLPRYLTAGYPLKKWLTVGVTWDRRPR